MTYDLRDLLRQARDGLSEVWLAYSKVEGDRGSIVLTHGSLIQRIDAALSEPAPEPVVFINSKDLVAMQEGQFQSCLVSRFLTASARLPLYTAQPPTSPSAPRKRYSPRDWVPFDVSRDL